MKINVHGGHNSIVQGASGFLNEVQEDRKIKDLVVAQLKTLGHTVYDCTDELGTTQSKNLSNIVAKCNSHSVDLDISIHFNASNGKGHGVEVLVYKLGNTASKYAQNICNAIAELGFKNRGVKASTSLYVLRKTKAPSLLIECCFVDSQKDYTVYNSNTMASAIVKGITGTTATVTTNQTANTTATVKPTTQTTTSKGNEVIKLGQQHSINFTGSKITVDGIRGTNTKKNGIRCVQNACNLDYGSGLAVDGAYGTKTKTALGSHYVKKGETQYLVTAVEILLMMRGYDPQGVECPGIFGSGLESAVRQFQKDNGLTVDGIAGKNTIKKLMGV